MSDRRAVVLVDGEHYPPVTLDGIGSVRARGFEVVAAVFCGGGEKLSGPLALGDLPIVRGPDPAGALRSAIETFSPAVVFDLSDDPVVDHAVRMRLAAATLAAGVSYEAAGFRMDPPHHPRLATVPAIAVIGTGKRCGKTAVCAHVARTLKASGMRPAIVAMGRGGPAAPRVVRGDLGEPSLDDLIGFSEAGEHAASDLYEDALTAGVAVVGARRAGAGPAGEPVADTVAAAVEEANRLNPDVVLLEGSGTAMPPVAVDATILVARPGETGRWPGIHRILLADLLVVTMSSVDSTSTISAPTSLDREQAQGVSLVAVCLRPTPLGRVAGRTVYVATTAPDAAGRALRDHLERAHGAAVAGISHRLADRARLAEDLENARGTYQVLACELKAAAVDVAVKEAIGAGAEVAFIDNQPTPIEGDLEAEIRRIARLARERFAKATGS